MSKSLPLWIRLWFVADLALVLAPPIHWAANGPAPILGVPRVLAYLFGASVFAAASVIAAYFSDESR